MAAACMCTKRGATGCTRAPAASPPVREGQSASRSAWKGALGWEVVGKLIDSYAAALACVLTWRGMPLEFVPTSATVFALERAGFHPFAPQLLRKCFWMFRAPRVCLGGKHGRSHPHPRVILQGARREEYCRDKVEKMLLLLCQKSRLL